MYEVTRIHNTAPNGVDIDIFHIMEIPNCDNSGVEYVVDYQQFDFQERYVIGNVCLQNGTIDFVHAPNGTGISFEALKLLAEWIEKNKEPE